MTRRLRLSALLATLSLLQPALTAQPAQAPVDLLIRNGRVLDGNGNPWVRADIAIRGDRIVAMGALEGVRAATVIDARDRYVAPGFIDAGLSAPFFANASVREMRGRAVPTRRLGLPMDIAQAVMFLASDEASYINGHELVVDGGVVSSLLAQLPREPAQR